MSEQVPYQRAPGWVWRRTRGSVLVMGPDGTAHQLDGAAALTWLALQEPGTATDVVRRGRDHGAPDAASDDEALGAWVDDALATLLAQHIVVPVGRRPAP